MGSAAVLLLLTTLYMNFLGASSRRGGAGCGGELSNSQGLIKSPHFEDGFYPDSASCKWKINLRDGRKRIRVTFITFEIESEEKCNYDYLEIFDGGSQRSPLAGKFCGYSKPKEIISSTNMLYLKFHSDGSISKKGFKLSYEAFIDCDLTFRGSSGIITSPSYPQKYPSDVSCNYDITVPENKFVALKFFDLDIPAHSKCQYDSVQIFDGIKRENSSLGLFCGSTWRSIPTIYSKANKMLLTFYSDATVTARGFRAAYKALRRRCSINNGGCDQICFDKRRRISCTCLKGYRLGGDRQSCQDIDECETHTARCEHKCVNLPGSYTCECLPGFKKDPKSPSRCVDVDECSTPPLDCHNCMNFAGGYECKCNRGYEQDKSKTRCLDVNECGYFNGGCNKPHQQCVNVNGSYYCTCSNGYKSLDNLNLTCVDINECEANSGKGHCDHSCLNVDGSFSCQCKSGYRLASDGKSCICYDGYQKMKIDSQSSACIDIDECKTGTHRCESGCVNTVGSYICKCDSGFTLYNGSRCIDIEECARILTKPLCKHNCTGKNASTHITPTALQRGHNFKYSGVIDKNDYFHSISIHEESGNTIAPAYFKVPDGREIPYYHPNVYGTSTEYDPAGNCEGVFTSSRFKVNNNCYNYATNIATSSFAQPGRMTGLEPYNFNNFGEGYVKGAESDGLMKVHGDPRDFLRTQEPHKGHLVALLISMPKTELHWPGDFHWVRCDNTWSGQRWAWSQKAGGDQITNFDFAGEKISDPQTANWNSNAGPILDSKDVVISYAFKTYMYVPDIGVRLI